MSLPGFLPSSGSHGSKSSFQGVICSAFQGCNIQLAGEWQPDPHTAVQQDQVETPVCSCWALGDGLNG